MNDSDSPSSTPNWDSSAFVASTAKAREAMTAAQTAMAGFKETIASVGEGLVGLAAQFAMPALNAFADGIKNAMEQGRQFADQARQVSQSVSTMVELQQAFESAGVSGDAVTNSLFALNKALDNVDGHGKPATDALAKLGLSADSLKGMSGVQQFKAIIQGLQGLPDATSRATAAQDIFRESAKDIMGVLNDPSGFNEAIEGSSHYAKTMQQNAKAFEEVGKAANGVQLQINDFYAEVAGALAPALEGVLSLTKEINLAGIGESFADGMKLVGEAFKEGDLHNLIYLELKQGFMDAINFLSGALIQIPDLLSAAVKSVFNAELLDGLTKGFKGVAEAFGAALLDAMRPQINYVQQSMSYYFDKYQAHDGAQAAKANADAMHNQISRNLRSASEDRALGDTKAAARDFAAAQDAERMEKVSRAEEKRLNDMANMNYGDYMAAHANDTPTWFGQNYDQNLANSQKDLQDSKDALAKAFKPLADQWNISMGAIAGTNVFGNDLQANQTQLTQLLNAAGINAGSQDNTPPQSKISTNGDQSQSQQQKASPQNDDSLSFKPIEADRFAKIGFFIGGAPQAPGISEARRTAKATEETVKLLNRMDAKLDQRSPVTAVYV